MKRQDQKHMDVVAPRVLECSQDSHSEHQVTPLYRPPHLSCAGKAHRLMAAGQSGNNYDCIQRYYFC